MGRRKKNVKRKGKKGRNAARRDGRREERKKGQCQGERKGIAECLTLFRTTDFKLTDTVKSLAPCESTSDDKVQWI